MVNDVHLTMVVHPEGADNDVVDGCRHLTPRVVVAGLVEQEVRDSWRFIIYRIGVRCGLQK